LHFGQARDLKKEPYDIEIQEEVEKEWATIQEEADEKRRQKNVANASNAAARVTQELEKRIEVLETFVHNWQPQFEEWQRMKSCVKELGFPCGDAMNEGAPETQLALRQQT